MAASAKGMGRVLANVAEITGAALTAAGQAAQAEQQQTGMAPPTSTSLSTTTPTTEPKVGFGLAQALGLPPRIGDPKTGIPTDYVIAAGGALILWKKMG